MPPNIGCPLEYYMLVLFVKTQFLIEFQTANQLEFEPGSPRPKVATLTIELHSIDLLIPCLYYFIKDKE